MTKFYFRKTKGFIEAVRSNSPGAEARDCVVKLLLTLEKGLFDASSESDRAILAQFEAYVSEVSDGSRAASDGWELKDERKHPVACYTVVDRSEREVNFEGRVSGKPVIKCESGLLYWQATLRVEGELRMEQFAALYDMSQDAIYVTTSGQQSDIPTTPSGADRVPDPENTEMMLIEHEEDERHLLEFDSPRQLPPGSGPRALPPGDGPIELGPIDERDDEQPVIDDDELAADRAFLDAYEATDEDIELEDDDAEDSEL